jgi:hypothetical protein
MAKQNDTSKRLPVDHVFPAQEEQYSDSDFSDTTSNYSTISEEALPLIHEYGHTYHGTGQLLTPNDPSEAHRLNIQHELYQLCSAQRSFSSITTREAKRSDAHHGSRERPNEIRRRGGAAAAAVDTALEWPRRKSLGDGCSGSAARHGAVSLGNPPGCDSHCLGHLRLSHAARHGTFLSSQKRRKKKKKPLPRLPRSSSNPPPPCRPSSLPQSRQSQTTLVSPTCHGTPPSTS